MREISMELDEETVEQLDVELDLLGFETRSEYLRWLVDNRASIDQGTEHDRLLHAYADRLDALERRLDQLEAMDAGETDVGLDDATLPGEGTATAGGSDDTSGFQIHGSPDSTRTVSASGAEDEVDSTTTARATDATATAGPTAGEASSEAATATTDAAPGGADAGSADGTSDPGDAASATIAGGDRSMSSNTDSTVAPSDSSGDGSSSSVEDAGVTSMNLAPERVGRISEDPISEEADVLSGVETERLDELTRRAVAKTREQLDRNVETGLSYRSSTSLADEDVRPGDDITDLDSLELPGRSEETLRPRREAAGRALAFLRDTGDARRSDFVDALYEEFPAGYETESGWWNCIKTALKQVEAVDGGQGSRVWRFDG